MFVVIVHRAGGRGGALRLSRGHQAGHVRRSKGGLDPIPDWLRENFVVLVLCCTRIRALEHIKSLKIWDSFGLLHARRHKERVFGFEDDREVFWCICMIN